MKLFYKQIKPVQKTCLKQNKPVYKQNKPVYKQNKPVQKTCLQTE